MCRKSRRIRSGSVDPTVLYFCMCVTEILLVLVSVWRVALRMRSCSRSWTIFRPRGVSSIELLIQLLPDRLDLGVPTRTLLSFVSLKLFFYYFYLVCVFMSPSFKSSVPGFGSEPNCSASHVHTVLGALWAQRGMGQNSSRRRRHPHRVPTRQRPLVIHQLPPEPSVGSDERPALQNQFVGLTEAETFHSVEREPTRVRTPNGDQRPRTPDGTSSGRPESEPGSGSGPPCSGPEWTPSGSPGSVRPPGRSRG